MIISAIVAMGKNRVIGKDNQLLWHLPEEFAHFKRTTLNHHIIMGRKTYDSVGKPLPKRTSIIITRDQSLNRPGALVVNGLEEALKLAKESGESEAFITGGAEIYKLSLPYLHKLYLTEVDCQEEGEAYFPIIDNYDWKITHSEFHEVTETNSMSWEFKLLEKTPSKILT